MLRLARLVPLLALVAFAPACRPASAGTSIQSSPQNALATAPGGSLQAYFVSNEVDLMVTGNYGWTNWPSMPGYQAWIVSSRFVATNLAATTFASAATFRMGNNVNHDNMYPANSALITHTVLNTYLPNAPGGPFYGLALTGALTGAAAIAKNPDLTTPPTFEITVAPTGTAITQAKGRVFVQAYLTALTPTL
jgi:hypothetical protein